MAVENPDYVWASGIVVTSDVPATAFVRQAGFLPTINLDVIGRTRLEFESRIAPSEAVVTVLSTFGVAAVYNGTVSENGQYLDVWGFTNADTPPPAMFHVQVLRLPSGIEQGADIPVYSPPGWNGSPGGGPTGLAGGDLASTYPDPEVVAFTIGADRFTYGSLVEGEKLVVGPGNTIISESNPAPGPGDANILGCGAFGPDGSVSFISGIVTGVTQTDIGVYRVDCQSGFDGTTFPVCTLMGNFPTSTVRGSFGAVPDSVQILVTDDAGTPSNARVSFILIGTPE